MTEGELVREVWDTRCKHTRARWMRLDSPASIGAAYCMDCPESVVVGKRDTPPPWAQGAYAAMLAERALEVTGIGRWVSFADYFTPRRVMTPWGMREALPAIGR